jgi:hypothetical protein
VSGSNTGNSPTTLIAFSYLGGLVFQESGGSGKVATDVTQEFNSAWIGNFPTNVAGATSLDDGVANTNAIVANGACSTGCAAQGCRNISVDWYLPARNELSTVHDSLCSNDASPCDFGGFSNSFYWSSSQYLSDSNQAWFVTFPLASIGTASKPNNRPVRCVRTF